MLQLQISHTDTVCLHITRQHVGEKQAEFASLRSQTSVLATRELPGLIQDMATLEISTVLHGDYNLKMARQDYFTSKQDTVCVNGVRAKQRQTT